MKDHILQKYASNDAALARVRELESQLGIPLTERCDDITAAWDRIAALEDAAAARTTTASGEKPQPKAQPAPQSKPLFGLARAIAANSKTK